MKLLERLGIRASHSVQAERSPLGASGTINLDGYLRPSEYNPDLQGTRALAVWRRMRSSDATVSEALHHLIYPLLTATWEIEPPSGASEAELEATELVRRAYFDWPAQPFAAHLYQALAFLADGFSLFELTWQVVEDELSFTGADGEQVVGQRRQYLTWRRFSPRLPATIWRWLQEDGELVAVQQSVLRDGRLITPVIPAEQLLLYTHRPEGDDPSGVSILRPAYKAWAMKELIEKIAGIAYERHGAGILVGYVPADRADDQAIVARMEEVLGGVRAGESAYVVFPGPKAQATAAGGPAGYTFEIVTPPGGIPDFAPILTYWRSEIKAAMLARFAELGQAQVGARATADTQTRIWYDALAAIAALVSAAHDAPITRLVRANLTVERFPRLVARDIQAQDLLEFAQSTSLLVNSGALEPDAPARETIRKAIDFPPEAPRPESGADSPQPETFEPDGGLLPRSRNGRARVAR